MGLCSLLYDSISECLNYHKNAVREITQEVNMYNIINSINVLKYIATS